MNMQQAAVLRSETGEDIPLRGVNARGRLSGLLFELEVEQSYENTSEENIEALFTFPVPYRAVLLGLELQIGERALAAVSVRRQTAREQYEDAMEEGDSAALLEQAGEGLWTLSLGNLMAGERATIRYRYAELLDRKGDELRLMVPTCIAPRYGDPAAGGLEAHQVPKTSLLTAYPLSLSIDIAGVVAGAELHSPSHRISVAEVEDGKCVTLAADAFLDRDFILSLRGPETRAAALVARDGDGQVALASLDPALPIAAGKPLALKLLVDCSGSMGGSSIICARRALLGILDRLQPEDQLSITRFGSSVQHLMPPPASRKGLLPSRWRGQRGVGKDSATGGSLSPAAPETLGWLRDEIGRMQADLGGTEMGNGLSAAFTIPVPEGMDPAVLLITDAEVWSVPQMLELAEQSGHRLFVVAVGAAPAEALARQLAERTGGACEFVSPGEDAEAAILRMFNRMREPLRRLARVEWPAEPLWELPLPPAVFPGDTLHLMAGFAELPQGSARVLIVDDDGQEIRREVALPPAASHEVLPRLAASRRLSTLDEESAATLAERHQIASQYTSFVVVEQREADEKAQGLPALRAVPQMLAAGWGATARVDALSLFSAPRLAELSTDCFLESPGGAFEYDAPLAELSPKAPALSRRGVLAAEIPAAADATPEEVVRALAALLAAGTAALVAFDDLRVLGVPEEMIDWVKDVYAGLVEEGSPRIRERKIVALFIALLVRSPLGDLLAADERTRLQGTALGDRDLRELRIALSPAFQTMDAREWTPAAAGVPR